MQSRLHHREAWHFQEKTVVRFLTDPIKPADPVRSLALIQKFVSQSKGILLRAEIRAEIIVDGSTIIHWSRSMEREKGSIENIDQFPKDFSKDQFTLLDK